MAYYQSQVKANTKWKKKALKRIPFDVRKEWFEEVLKPAAEAADMPINSFLKMLVEEYVEEKKGTE